MLFTLICVIAVFTNTHLHNKEEFVNKHPRRSTNQPEENYKHIVYTINDVYCRHPV